MKTNFLKICAALVAMLLIVACVPVVAFAAGTTASKTAEEIVAVVGEEVDGLNVSLDNAISVRFDKAASSTAPKFYTDAIRMYQNGATLTISAAPGCQMTTIVLTISSTAAGQGPISVKGGTATALTDLKYTITVNSGVSEVVVTATGADKDNRCYVAGIAVTYEGTAPTTPYVPTVQGPQEVSLAEAKTLDDGTKVIVKGTVTEVAATSYGTYNVTITDGTDTYQG